MEFKMSDDNKKESCASCGSANILIDHIREEIICQDCGFVGNCPGKIEPDWSIFTDTEIDPSNISSLLKKCARQLFRLQDEGLSTLVHYLKNHTGPVAREYLKIFTWVLEVLISIYLPNLLLPRSRNKVISENLAFILQRILPLLPPGLLDLIYRPRRKIEYWQIPRQYKTSQSDADEVWNLTEKEGLDALKIYKRALEQSKGIDSRSLKRLLLSKVEFIKLLGEFSLKYKVQKDSQFLIQNIDRLMSGDYEDAEFAILIFDMVRRLNPQATLPCEPPFFQALLNNLDGLLDLISILFHTHSEAWLIQDLITHLPQNITPTHIEKMFLCAADTNFDEKMLQYLKRCGDSIITQEILDRSEYSWLLNWIWVIRNALDLKPEVARTLLPKMQERLIAANTQKNRELSMLLYDRLEKNEPEVLKQILVDCFNTEVKWVEKSIALPRFLKPLFTLIKNDQLLLEYSLLEIHRGSDSFEGDLFETTMEARKEAHVAYLSSRKEELLRGKDTLWKDIDSTSAERKYDFMLKFRVSLDLLPFYSYLEAEEFKEKVLPESKNPWVSELFVTELLCTCEWLGLLNEQAEELMNENYKYKIYRFYPAVRKRFYAFKWSILSQFMLR